MKDYMIFAFVDGVETRLYQIFPSTKKELKANKNPGYLKLNESSWVSLCSRKTLKKKKQAKSHPWQIVRQVLLT